MADVTAASGGGERRPFDTDTPPGPAGYRPGEEQAEPPAPVPHTGWTATMPAITLPPAPPPQPPGPAPVPPPAAAPLTAATVPPGPGPTGQPAAPQLRGFGAGLRGRILVVEGGYGSTGRRPWGRGSSQAPVLSAMLAAVSPHVLLASDAVDAVHLPGAGDPQTVLAHLRAAARHPGPLLVHIGGHLVTDRRGEQLFLTLRDARSHDTLPWHAVATELQHRPQEWDTLVVGDLSADQTAWPLVQSTISPLTDGVPLWAVVNPDPDQVGTFTRALIEVLHVGVPGAGPVLAPEELRGQVHSVLRPEAAVLQSHAPDRPVFRNTSRQIGDTSTEARLNEAPRPSAVQPKRPGARPGRPRPAAPASAAPRITLAKAQQQAVPRGPVSLLKPGVPPTPPRPPRPVSLRKQLPGDPPVPPPLSTEAAAETAELARTAVVPDPMGASAEEPGAAAGTRAARVELGKRTDRVELGKRTDRVELGKRTEASPSAEPAAEPASDYRDAVGRIVRAADAGEHDTAAELALALEEEAVAVHGTAAPEVLQVRQVRAHVSRLAGRTVLAADLYREVALALLGTAGAEDPETQRAATNAEACWRAVADPVEAIRIAPEIIELRAHLPGPDGRKLRAAERYLAKLAAAAAEG
ncbi:hypothetical protein [Kitasatospora sp. DSM 101779]|uniref:hypothetical protein n=1 Tax=Kitasatospora sp. DSM 101779 TaxID=2853165 RepID=UPI0021DA8687|nr:hypothetical protein [Kitasatospora sp. DSM 101779]MCU7821743.1 hypothetical protein [Kitasatospora sp. DSM 101779]